jgi:excinuclease ABC subunit A
VSVTRTIVGRGIKVHNLKSVDVDLPLDRLIVFTGVSGSGKSSLAFDTLYAEGQRRYIETFSAYTRQFLETLDRPDADRLEGIPPAIAVAQHRGRSRRSGRSTVGSLTEILDHLALLYARVGVIICEGCGERVEPASPSIVVEAIEHFPDGTRYLIAYPIDLRPETDHKGLADRLRADGLTRVRVEDRVVGLDDGSVPEGATEVVVDRLIRGSENPSRRLDSIETAFDKGLGRCRVIADDQALTFVRGWRCARCGREYHAPEPQLFRWNNPLGACSTCLGSGHLLELDLDRIVPDRSKSLKDRAIAPWNSPGHKQELTDLLKYAKSRRIPTSVPFSKLTPAQLSRLLDGEPEESAQGLRARLHLMVKSGDGASSRKRLRRWQGEVPCPSCRGSRLRPEALAVQVKGWNIAELAAKPVREVHAWLDDLLRQSDGSAVRQIVQRTRLRVDYLVQIGLGYLTLDRPARTISAGEAQRVALTSALGSGLVRMLYVLDEPSVGLHPRDVDQLITIVRSLRDVGNTVIVVEHDEAIVQSADLVVEIGPGAGEAGGRILSVGPPSSRKGDSTPRNEFNAGNSPPLERGSVPRVGAESSPRSVSGRKRRSPTDWLRLTGATGNTLKSVDAEIPTGVLCVVTGVSGSGKSSLIEHTLYPALRRKIGKEADPPLPFAELTGWERFEDVILMDASPIGRSGRSNPVTYLKAYDEIRKTFAATHEAKARNYRAGRFSFNVDGGRCNACEGNGYLTVDMQFLPDVLIRCPECKGTRFRPETLEVTYRGKNIAEILDMTARSAFSHFQRRPVVQARLRPLLDVGLDYLRLGQPASTLSGGEAQRLKLARHLATTPGAITRAAGRRPTLFLLDEPTSGLHAADTRKLLEAMESLLVVGHSLIVIEHSPDVMVAADWILDLGPGAGDEGGKIVAAGTPEDVARVDSPTGHVLAEAID